MRLIVLFITLLLVACQGSDRVEGSYDFCESEKVIYAGQQDSFCVTENKGQWQLVNQPSHGVVEPLSNNRFRYISNELHSGEVGLVFSDGQGRSFTRRYNIIKLTDSFLLSREGSERATSYNDSNKIVNFADKMHVTWLDDIQGQSYVKVRTFDKNNHTWSQAYTVDEARDNHGGAAMIADKDGYLHIVYYPHSQDPFRYRRSVRPNDVSEWEDVEYFGTNGTYPALVMLDDGTLLVFSRVSRWQEPWYLALHRRDPNTGWSDVIKVVEGNHGKWLDKAHPDFYASIYFQSPAVAPDGKTVHLGFAISEAAYGQLPDRAYVVGYAQSFDGGLSWTGKNQQIYPLPLDPQAFEIVEGEPMPEPDKNYFLGNLALDPKGRPWMIYGRLDLRPYETWLAMRDEQGQWRKINLLPAVKARYPRREIHMPGSMTFDKQGRMYIVLSSTDQDASGMYPYWAHASNKVITMVSQDYGKTFAVMLHEQNVVRREQPTIDWLPNLEVSTTSVLGGVPSWVFTASVLDPQVMYRTIANEVYFASFNDSLMPVSATPDRRISSQ